MTLSRGSLAAVLAVLSLALAWQLGQRRGYERGVIDGRRVAAVPSPTLDAVTSRAVREAELATVTGERDMARAAVRSLRVELARAGELAAAERAELELYRRLGGDTVADGLSIDTLERRARSDGAAPTLLLTLVQARGRERVGGRVEVVALDADAPTLAPAAPFAPEPTDEGIGWRGTFDLRFFETLEIALDGASGGFPPAIDVRVIPENSSRHEPFRRRFRREDIPEVD